MFFRDNNREAEDHDDQDHGHGHDHRGAEIGRHGHTHGIARPSILTTGRGIWAVGWLFAGLSITATFQVIIVR